MDNPEVFKFFPIPVFKFKFEKFRYFNEELSNFIYKLYEEDSKGVDRSNRGGWHSKTFELNDKNSIQLKFALELQKYILKTFTNLGWKTENQNIRIREMWAIINKKDDFNVVHTHPNSLLSAAYYVKAPKNCGHLVFESQNEFSEYNLMSVQKQETIDEYLACPAYRIVPTEGLMVLFPSHLRHYVDQNESDEDRISMAFNIDFRLIDG